jgi:hypothetical protein
LSTSQYGNSNGKVFAAHKNFLSQLVGFPTMKAMLRETTTAKIDGPWFPYEFNIEHLSLVTPFWLSYSFFVFV